VKLIEMMLRPPMTIILQTAYGDAETRGKVRLGKQKLARDRTAPTTDRVP
jgi:hypothetical protein